MCRSSSSAVSNDNCVNIMLFPPPPLLLISRICASQWKNTPFFARVSTSGVYVLQKLASWRLSGFQCLCFIWSPSFSQSVVSLTPSSKGKTPWMIYDGQEIADSHFCIQYINRKLKIDLNVRLSEEDRAVARAFQMMTEDHLYWWVQQRASQYKEVVLPV